MACVAEFQDRFPQFRETDELRVKLFLDDAALIMGEPSRWIDFFDVSHQYLAAHFLYLAEQSESGDGTAIAPVNHQEVNDVVVKTAVSAAPFSADDLNATTYGKSYLRYLKMIFQGPYGV